MNKNYTLKELAEIYMGSPMPESACTNTIRAGIQKVLDAIGYEFPKDEEREAFERWQKSMLQGFGGDQYSFEKAAFEAWKAGREELRRATAIPVCAVNPDAKPKEPAWIPWEGGECPLGDGMIWEAKLRSGTHVKAKGLACRWDHNGRAGDIVAYRVLEG